MTGDPSRHPVDPQSSYQSRIISIVYERKSNKNNSLANRRKCQ